MDVPQMNVLLTLLLFLQNYNMAILIRNNSRNPLTSWSVNPARNWQIDPTRNWQIDPTRNWQIDPARNWQVNPNRNWQVNPNRNWQVNPNRNWHINPLRNWQINPLKKSALNPSSINFRGLYAVSPRSAECNYFIVKTDLSNVMLGYDEFITFNFIIVGINNVFSVFSMDLEYIGFLCPNSQGGYNWFDLEKKWLYFII